MKGLSVRIAQVFYGRYCKGICASMHQWILHIWRQDNDLYHDFMINGVTSIKECLLI